jgi:uncharacterized membrane protein YfcA
MLSDPLTLVVLTVAVVILGLSKGGFAGIGMLSTPLMASVVDPLVAVGLMLPIMLVQDAAVVWLYRRSYSAAILRRMLPGGVVGVITAYVFATAVPVWAVKAMLGAVSVVFSSWQIAVSLRGLPSIPKRARYDGVLGASAGAACGFTSAIAHAGFPPFQIYVMPKGLAKEIYVGTSVMFFAGVNLMKLPSFASLGLFSAETLQASAIMVPLAITSSWLGAHVVRKVDAEKFRLIITGILFVIGLELLRQAFWAMS